MKKLSMLLVALFVAGVAFAQQNIFSKVYSDDAGNVQAYGVVSTFDHNILVVGERDQNGLIMKINSSGDSIWCKKIGDDNQTVFTGIISTSDSNYVLLGRCKNIALNNVDVFCVKINSDGDTLWSKSYDLGYAEYATSIQLTNDKGFIISGIDYQSSSAPYAAMFILKLDSIGSMTWVKKITYGNWNNHAYSVKQMPDSGYAMIGFTESKIGTTYDGRACLIRLSSNGNVLWSKILSLTSSYGYDLAITHDGILCLIAPQNGTGIVIAKTDFTGNVLWSKSYNTYFSAGNFTDVTPKLYPIYDGGFIYNTGGAFTPGSLVKIDSIGNMVWLNYLELIVSNVIETPDSGIMVIGNGPIMGVKTLPTYNPQIGIITTDSAGTSNLFCINNGLIYNSIINLNYTAIACTIATGGSVAVRHPVVSDFTLDIYNGCVAFIGSIKENETENIVIYPNPAQENITIEMATPDNNAAVSIYNMQGQHLMQHTIINPQTTIDINGLSPGLYFIKLFTPEGITAKKFIKQ